MSRTGAIKSEEVRALLRRDGQRIEERMRLQPRDGTVRVSLMAAAFDEYSEIPREVRQLYDPEQHAIVIPLPDPEEGDRE